MTFKQMQQKLDYFGAIMLAYQYIDDYVFGITANNRPKIEFIYKNLDVLVVYIPTKGFQCYVDHKDIGIFNNYEQFKKYVDKTYK